MGKYGGREKARGQEKEGKDKKLLTQGITSFPRWQGSWEVQSALEGSLDFNGSCDPEEHNSVCILDKTGALYRPDSKSKWYVVLTHSEMNATSIVYKCTCNYSKFTRMKDDVWC